MNVIFKEAALEELYLKGDTKDRKYRILCRNKKLVELLKDVRIVNDLKIFSILHYEKLKYRKEPMSSVRILNGSIERLLFTETKDGIEVELIEIDSTHYGNK